MIEVTLGQFKTLFGGVHDAAVERYRDALNGAMAGYGVHTAQRAAAYLAQIAHESMGLTRLEEDFRYRPERLLAVFPRYFRGIAEAQQYAEAGPEAIANHVYASRMGNGDESSGDGWRYRGSGPLGVTGKDNYAAVGLALGLPLVTDPDAMREIEVGMLASGYLWKNFGCNQLADHDDFDAISDIINLGHHTVKVGDSNGFADRLKRWLAARTVLGLSNSGLA